MQPGPDVLICIENGSPKEAVDEVRSSAPPATKLVALPNNVGFPAGVNAGMDIALEHGSDWVLLLNNDAVAFTSCLARCMAEAVALPKVAAVGPAISFMEQPDKLWFGGGEVSDWFAFTRHRALMGASSKPPATSDTAFVTGCCMLISAATWKSVGPFRADFFAYYEDAEWCQRARADAWRCRYVGEVLCSHAVSVSSATRGSLGLSETTAYYMARNPMRFALETKRLGKRVTRILGLMTVWNLFHAWRAMQSKRLTVARAYVRGLIDAFRGRMGPEGRTQS